MLYENVWIILEARLYCNTHLMPNELWKGHIIWRQHAFCGANIYEVYKQTRMLFKFLLKISVYVKRGRPYLQRYDTIGSFGAYTGSTIVVNKFTLNNF